MRRTKAEVRDSTTSTQRVIFELDLSFCTKDYFKQPGEHSIVMRGPPGSDIIGTADVSFTSVSKPIRLCLSDGDVGSPSDTWEDIRCLRKSTMNYFELSIDLGGSLGRRVFYWTRTQAVGDANVMTRKLDWLHLKLVEAGGKKVLARFAHHFKLGSKKGDFELLEYEGGSRWESVVILSGTAVLEYLRKMSGWSWWRGKTSVSGAVLPTRNSCYKIMYILQDRLLYSM